MNKTIKNIILNSVVYLSCGYIPISLIIFSIPYSLPAQQIISREYQVKAVFLYNFTHFVEWQPGMFEDASAPFVIGILGDDPFGSYLDETVKGERILGHPIVIHRYIGVKDIKNCNILYVTKLEVKGGREILSVLNEKHILTVSDNPNFAKEGGMIQFFTQNNKIRLLINLTPVKAAGLNISSKLLRVAETLKQ